MGSFCRPNANPEQIAGVLFCYDRVIVQGTLAVFCYADGMKAYLTKPRIRVFDFTQFAKPLTDAIQANAEALAAASGLTTDSVRKENFRKEDKVKAVVKEWGTRLWIGVDLLRAGRPAPPSSHGTTRTPGGRTCGPMMANAYTTLFRKP
jgi:hypothetical protein